MYKRRSRNKGATPTGFSTSTPADNVNQFSAPSQSPINDRVRNSQKKRNILQVDKSAVSASKHAKVETELKFNSYFDEMVIKAGLILQPHDNNVPHMLTKDQALFIRDLDSALKKSASYPENVKEFLGGLEKHFVNNGQFLKLLKSVKTCAGCEIARGQLQDSLIRQLLQIECLQSKIIEMLLEKLAEFVLNESDDQDSSVPWVQMILHQMRLLDNIVDGKTLNDTLFAVLETAPIPAQREIIYCLPDILADEEHHEAALMLSKLMKDKFELTSAVIEALDSLDLQPDLRAEVCQHMLVTLRRAPPEFLPSIIGFLVSFQGSNEDLVELVAGLRKELDMTPAGGIDSSSQVLIMAALRSGALRCSGLADVWLKAISSTQSPSEIYPLDIVMLLVFHSTVQRRKKQVETVLRNRIKNGILTEAIINKTFTILLVVIKEYLKSAVEVASLLLRSPESPVSYIGGRWFKLMLEHLDEIHSQSVVFDLLLLIGTGDHHITNASLQVMADTETKHLVPHAAVLLGLLEKLQDMALVQAGQVMDVLCRLVYSNERDSLHEDDIHILIRKYLSSSNNMLKEKGVVSAVMAVKNMASAESEDGDIPSSISSSESVLSVRGRRAKDLLEFVEESIQQNVLALGLFYDQMAAMICSSSMCDSTFLEWVGEKTAQNFQDFYVKDMVEINKERSDSSTQFLLDTDLDGAICVDIIGVMKEEKLLGSNGLENGHPICLIAPLFLLLRTVKFRNDNGDLASIDALLGCGVTMPNNLTDLVDDFPLLDSEKQIFLLDSLFYCINWFRELVNAFAYQKSTDLQRKVIIRLHDVVTLQQLLVKCLCHARTMDYKPPRCHFHIEVKPPQQEKVKKPAVPRKGVKRGKGKKETAHTSVVDVTEAATEEVAPLGVSSKSEIDLTQYKGFFREVSMDVFVLLGNKLIIQPEGEEQEACMRPVDLLFLLEDYIAKLDHYLPSTTKRINVLRANQQPSSVGFSNLMMNHIAPQVFARNTIKLLPHIVKMLRTAGDYCQNLLEQNNGVYDGPTMFKEDTADIKLCYSLLIGAVAVTLGWSGLRSNTNLEMLRDGLWALASRVMEKDERSASVKVLVLKGCEYLISYSSRTLYLPAAWNLVRAIQVLCSHAPSEGQPREQLAAVCHDFLSRKWYTLKGLPEQGSAYNQHISSLLATYLEIMSDDLSQIRNIVMWVKDEAAALEHKESSLKTFPSITKLNLFILYQNLWRILVRASQKALQSTFGCDDKLKVWHCIASIMENLITIIKQHDHRCNQQALLKHSQVIMKTFLSEGVPVLETLLKSNPENVTNMLKTLQTTSRYLHLLCVTTKAEKMSSLLNHLPVVRRTQEALLYRIKGMLAANNCSDAFWMGNLKNKTLKGEEVLTQDSTENGEEEEGEQDEVEEEDDNSDVDMNSRSDEDDNGSVSDTY